MTIDKSQFEKHLFEPESAFEILIRGHLWMEYLVNSILTINMTDSRALDLGRIGFRQKIDICQAFGFITKDDGNSLRVLNHLRNKLARNLTAEPSEREIEELIRILSNTPRVAYDAMMRVSAVIQQVNSDVNLSRLRYWFLAFAIHLDYLCAITKYNKDNDFKLIQVAAARYASIHYLGEELTEEQARQQFGLSDPPKVADSIR